MSITATTDDETRDASNLRLLPTDGESPVVRPLDLDSDLRLTVAGRSGGEYHARVEHAGTILGGETGDVSLFDPGVGRSRFVSTAARLAAAIDGVNADRDTIADAIHEALDDVAEMVADGRLLVVDEETLNVIDQTESVVFDPSTGTWTLTFPGETFDRREYTFSKVQSRISAKHWAEGTPSHSLPDTVETTIGEGGGRIDTDRWTALQHLWTEMAEVGDAPPSTRPITEAYIRERGVLPGTRMPVEQFEAIAEEHDRIKWAWREGDGVTHKERPELHHAARELGLLDEFDDLNGDEVTVRSMEYKGEDVSTTPGGTI